MIFIVGYILVKGIPNIKPELFAWEYTSKNVSMMPAIINTLLMTGFTLLMAVPIGVFSAVYLAEYAEKGFKACTYNPSYSRNTIWNTFNCIRSLRFFGLRYRAEMGIFVYRGLYYACNNGASGYNAYNRGSDTFCA